MEAQPPSINMVISGILKKEILRDKTLCRIFGIIIFIILTSFGAFVRIRLPFTPVPITLQTFFVLLSGAVLGNLGVVSQLSYIILGVGGLPVFTNAGSGLSYLFGPTGGYLFGFLLASYFVSISISKSKSFISIFILMCLADLIILSLGIIWLKILFRYSINRLLIIGFLPFIPGDLLKIILASSLFLKIKPRIREIF